MKTSLFRKIIISICIGLFVFLSCEQTKGQQKIKYVSACHIFDNLVFGLRFNRTIEEINNTLIKQIQERGVDFTLSSEEENSFKRIGASDSLIRAIRENFSEELQNQINLYKKFTDNYAGKTFEQKKNALDAAYEFIEKYGDNEDFKNVIEYLKKIIPVLEKQIANKIQK